MDEGKQHEVCNNLRDMASIYPILLSNEGRSISINVAGISHF